MTMSGPMCAPARDQWRESLFGCEGGHYNVFACNDPVKAMEMLREAFPDGNASEMNLVFFSTSGIHGSYCTIEEVWPPRFKRSETEERAEFKRLGYVTVTFLLVNPRLVSTTHGNVAIASDDDARFLKRLRSSTWRAARQIGRA